MTREELEHIIRASGNITNQYEFVVDLFMSKAWAGRDKDRKFCIGLLQHAFVKLEDALAMVPRMPLNETQHRTLTQRIKRWAA